MRSKTSNVFAKMRAGLWNYCAIFSEQYWILSLHPATAKITQNEQYAVLLCLYIGDSRFGMEVDDRVHSRLAADCTSMSSFTDHLSKDLNCFFPAKQGVTALLYEVCNDSKANLTSHAMSQCVGQQWNCDKTLSSEVVLKLSPGACEQGTFGQYYPPISPV